MADSFTPSFPGVETTVLGADEIILNMGPQHPSTHGVLRVKLRLDGEKVAGSECITASLVHVEVESSRFTLTGNKRYRVEWSGPVGATYNMKGADLGWEPS